MEIPDLPYLEGSILHCVHVTGLGIQQRTGMPKGNVSGPDRVREERIGGQGNGSVAQAAGSEPVTSPAPQMEGGCASGAGSDASAMEHARIRQHEQRNNLGGDKDLVVVPGQRGKDNMKHSITAAVSQGVKQAPKRSAPAAAQNGNKKANTQQ